MLLDKLVHGRGIVDLAGIVGGVYIFEHDHLAGRVGRIAVRVDVQLGVIAVFHNTQIVVQRIVSGVTNEIAQIQLVVALASITAGWLLQIPPTHWMILIACITAVLSLEMVNASLEKLCDLVEPSIHPQIKLIKDLAAGAVLLAAIASVIIGFFLFLPAVRHLL